MEKRWPQVYSCKFLTAGLVSYEDSGAGIARLDKKTIDEMLHTFIGRPVIIDHQNITPENYNDMRLKGVVVGNVIRCWFEPADGWFYCDFLVEDEKALKCIDQEGYSVSCAYDVLESVEGGTYQDIKYDGEITAGEFTHLALVQNPRYEESKIMKQFPTMLVNGKIKAYQKVNEEENNMFKIFKKDASGKKEEYAGMVMVNGKEMPLADLVKAYNEKNAEKKHVLNSADIVDIAGNKVTIGEMISKVAGTQGVDNKKNEGEEDIVVEGEEKTSKKNCSCGAKENEKHKENCKLNSKEEDKQGDRENEKEDEQEKDEKKDKAKEAKEGKDNEKEEKPEEKEKANDKDMDKEKKDNEKEEEKGEKKNAKEKGNEFFAELKNSNKQYEDNGPSSTAPLGRAERAKRWAEKNSNGKN